jgi:hypothetical protein
MLEALLLDLGGKALSKLVAKKFGADMGELAQQALEALGAAFGVEPKPQTIERRIDEVLREPEGRRRAEAAVAWAEAGIADQLLAEAALWKEANEQQRRTHELLQAQIAEGGASGAWLWIWQYIFMGLWLWAFVGVHLANAVVRLLGGTTVLPDLDLTILMTLTGSYLALHMGGHTVLELMRGGVFKRKGEGE